MTQLAVDYLEQMIYCDRNVKALTSKEWEDVIRTAKEMEQDQIIDAYSFGYTNGHDDAECPIPVKIDDAEQYYNETYKTNDNG